MSSIKPMELNSHPVEQAVLAALMTVTDSFETLPDHFDSDIFYFENHRVLFDAIKSLASKNSAYDAVLVLDYLVQHRQADQAGGEKYLLQLLAESPASLYNLPHFTKTLINLYERRKADLLLAQASTELKSRPELSAGEIISSISSKLAGSDIGESDAPKSTQQSANDLRNKLMAGEFSGTPTGFKELDNKIMGFAPGQMIVIAGRPAMGKSLLAGNLVDELEQRTGNPALVFSLEMEADEWTARIISNRSKVPYRCFKASQIEDDDVPKVKKALADWESRKIFINDRRGLTLEQMITKCRKFKRQHGQISCIALDYLQLLSLSKRSDSRVNDVSEMSRAMKVLAGDMGCPVIVLSQLNRGLESRPNKRPVMSDLRESGAIEQDADLIMFIYRDEVYNKDTQYPGIAEIIIGKQRSGPIGTVALKFNGAFARFENFDYQGEFDAQGDAA